MSAYLRQIIIGQFEAALAMLAECVEKCPAEHWTAKIGNNEFWHVAFHTLCCVDLYLAPSLDEFQVREFHNPDPDQWLDSGVSQRTKEEIKDYIAVCHARALDTISNESDEQLEGPSGFFWVPITRGELHIYNLRHIQHHTGQLSAYLRRINVDTNWVRTGWR